MIANVTNVLGNALFRVMRREDIPELVRMSRENMSSVIWTSWGIPWSDDTLLEMLNDPESMTEVLEADGIMAGYFTVERRDSSLFINSIQVNQGMKRRGHGRRMMQRIEGLAALLDLESVELWVQTSNLEAFGFYRMLGFDLVHQSWNNYLMRKDLGSMEVLNG
jgi:ribosomal protein S18 acetylase RimI-like enzyme